MKDNKKKKREKNQSLCKEKKYCLGKLQQLTPGWGEGGYSGFQVTGMID